jgi:hypothetical protein
VPVLLRDLSASGMSTECHARLLVSTDLEHRYF